MIATPANRAYRIAAAAYLDKLFPQARDTRLENIAAAIVRINLQQCQ